MCNHYRFSFTRSLHSLCQVTRTRDLIDLELADVPASTSGGKRSFLAKVTLFLDIAFTQCSATSRVCSQAFKKAQNLNAEESQDNADSAQHQDWSHLGQMGTDDVQTACARALSAVSNPHYAHLFP